MNCPKCNGEMWDNRERKRNPKAPDFKCKDKTCDGVIWPPKNDVGEGDGQPKTSGPAPSAYQNAKQTMHAPDERENRIQRQHSQHMALLYFALTPGKPPTTKQLRDMTSWFFRDIGHSSAETKNAEGEYDF